MTLFLKRAITAGILLLISIGCGTHTQPASNFDSAHAAAVDTVAATKVPSIGPWMMDSDGTPAHWLDEMYQGKHLREPINIILYDRNANSGTDAKGRLLSALVQAGFPARIGHSNDYYGLISGKRYEQLGDGKPSTFADGPFEFDNNHGRIFGPSAYNGGYLWIGAFSREKVAPFDKIKHQYVSFNQSRDAIAQRLDANTIFHRTGFINSGNVLIDRPDTTTGDHDGIAVMLETRGY